VEEPDEWRRVREAGDDHTQCTPGGEALDSRLDEHGDRGEHTHGHDSNGSQDGTCTSAAETAPTGGGLSAQRDDLDVPPTPSTVEALAAAPAAAAAAAAAAHAQAAAAEPPAPADSTSAPRLRTCAECQEPICGAVFMLHDQPYCCQRHRLAAYHSAANKRRSSSTENVAPAATAATGLAAKYGTW